MLTKDLVRFRRAKNKVHPQFIDPNKADLLELARELLDIFHHGIGKTRGELSQAVGDAGADSKVNDNVLKGLEKLLFDRTTFQNTDDDTMFAWRHQLFLKTNQWFSNESANAYPDFTQTIAASEDLDFDSLKEKLYGDLPDFLPSVDFNNLTPSQLLYRYNCAQVQWLLMQTKKLNIVLAHHDASYLRQFCKYLRFHQLLANITQKPNGSFHIEIDGPMNLFYQSQKYGLSLARFFPSILHQPHWRLEAEVALTKRSKHILCLDHQSKLKPYSHHFHAYIPKEIQKFQTSFQEKVSDWDITDAANFLPLDGESLCFPDFRLTHESGLHIDLEFFHPWHAAPLKTRLSQLKPTKKPPLLIGVSRKLAKKPELKKLLDQSAYFEKYGMLFSEIPVVKSIEKILKGLIQKEIAD